MNDQQAPDQSPAPMSAQTSTARKRWQKPVAVVVVSLALLGVGMAIGDSGSSATPSATAPPPASSPPATTVPGKHAGKHDAGKHKAQPVTPTTIPVPPAS
jgi:hypothetical protein